MRHLVENIAFKILFCDASGVGQKGVQIEPLVCHCKVAVCILWPFRMGPIIVKLHPVSVRIIKVKGDADPVIGPTGQGIACIQNRAIDPRQRRTVGIEECRMVKASVLLGRGQAFRLSQVFRPMWW